MTKKENFIKEIEELISSALNCQEMPFEGLSKEAKEYFDELKTKKQSSGTAGELTESGSKILAFMQKNYETYHNKFKAKEIGEGLFTSGRSIAGSMKKLVVDGWVDKESTEPITYSLTEKGKIKTII